MARLKADFVANVSHDLKTPLSVIRMFGETLEMGRVRDEATRQEYYRVITRESERLSRLIDNVLDFSRIEGGRRTTSWSPAPVEPLVRDTLESVRVPARRSRGSRSRSTSRRTCPTCRWTPTPSSQALANLIDNAIKYSASRKATRRVDARARTGGIALAVRGRGHRHPARRAGADLREVLPGGAQRDAGPARQRRGPGAGAARRRGPRRPGHASRAGRGRAAASRCGSPARALTAERRTDGAHPDRRRRARDRARPGGQPPVRGLPDAGRHQRAPRGSPLAVREAPDLILLDVDDARR